MFPTEANLSTWLEISRKDAEFELRKQVGEWGSETGTQPDVRLYIYKPSGYQV